MVLHLIVLFFNHYCLVNHKCVNAAENKKNVLTVLGNFLYCKHEKLQFALLSVFLLCFLLKCLMFKAMFANVEFFEFGLENEISSNTLGIPYKHKT